MEEAEAVSKVERRGAREEDRGGWWGTGKGEEGGSPSIMIILWMYLNFSYLAELTIYNCNISNVLRHIYNIIILRKRYYATDCNVALMCVRQWKCWRKSLLFGIEWHNCDPIQSRSDGYVLLKALVLPTQIRVVGSLQKLKVQCVRAILILLAVIMTALNLLYLLN